MKIISVFISIFVWTGLSAQTNLIENWDGNGDTNTATSYPNNYGWAITTGTFNYANSTGGVRWSDVTSGHTLNGANYSGRLLMVRWDGSGATSLSSVYSYPVVLEANKKYNFSWVYEWWNNASVPTYTVGIGTDKEGTNLVTSKSFTCSSTKNKLQQGEMGFYISTAGTYYVTIKGNNLAVLGGIGNLEITQVPSVLECSAPSVLLNYYESGKTFSVYPNGSADAITIVAPTGIKLSTASLPFTGGQVTVSSADSTNVSGNITIAQGSDVVTVPISASFPQGFFDLAKTDTLNADGAWCWFNDPRAIYYKGTKEQTYFSWVNKTGDIYISAYNHETGVYTEKLLHSKLEVDDHDNPAIFIRNDGRILVYFSKHTTEPGHRYISTNPEDITSWGSTYRYGENVTYPYPFQVDDKIYVFYRGLQWHPTLAISSDNGESLGTPQQIVAGGGSRPYARYCQDKTGAIHMAFTTGHPRDVANNKIYYARFKDGKFYKADGTFIKDFTGTETALDIDKNEAETVYNANVGKGWIWDITVDADNNPVMVYASFPTDTDHRYHYARWTGTQWYQKQLTSAGKWFPQTVSGVSESEPNYSGGIIMDADNPSVVYLSKQVKGVFEIFKFTTPDNGVTWDSTAITWNTPAHLINVRPIVPRNHKPGYFDVVWMHGTYVHYTNYNTSLVFRSDAATETLTSVAFDAESIEMNKGTSKLINVTFVPFLSTNKSLVWTTSDETVAQVTNGLVTAVGNGNATITATAFNGVKATCTVTVTQPNYVTNALFDFGTATSPVAGGALQVTDATLLSDSYGWTTAVLTRDRGAAATDELRDFNMSSANTSFKVFVKPGTYRITAKQGDLTYAHDNMNLSVNGQLMISNASSAVGSYAVNTFDVETAADMLEFAFNDSGGTDANWVINSLTIENLSATPVNQINVDPNNVLVGLMTVFDYSGKELFKESLAGISYLQTLNRGKLNPGLYLIKIESANGTQIFKHLISGQ